MEAIGSVVGGLIGADATRSAANKQADAAREATALQRYIFDTARGDQAPYREAGVDALARLRDFNDQPLRAVDVMGEPGYQFGLQQGLDNIQNSAAARGGLYSGAALKGLTRYANDYATTKYGDAWNRLQNDTTGRWNRLASLAGIGQTATNQTQQAGQNYANQAGAIGMSNANAQGAAGLANANIWGNALNGVISAGGRNNWWQGAAPMGGATGDFARMDRGFMSPEADWYTNPQAGYADGGPVRVPPVIGQSVAAKMASMSDAERAAMLQRLEADEAKQRPRMEPRGLDRIEAGERKALGMRKGGAVRGPGGPRADMIPARLSDGEHVMDAASVTAIGGGDNERGQRKLNALRALVKGAC